MEFREIQKFKQVWLWIIVFASTTPALYVLYLLLATKTPFETELWIALWVTGIISVSVLTTFFFLRLETSYSDSGITYRFYPVHFRTNTITWDKVSHWEVKTYSPLREYGGWGLRSNSKGEAFNVSGDKGLLLILKSGKQLLFGTQQPEALKEFLQKLKTPGVTESIH